MRESRDYTVLLVEDSEDDQILIRRAFAKAKLANPLHVAEDGDKAVAYLAGEGPYADREKHPLPTIILLDLKLPRRSGHEVLEWLRAHPDLRRIPVVILTSSAESEDVRRAYELGANSYLVKPVAFEGLMEMVRTLGVYWMVMNEFSDAKVRPPSS
jgi:CheY-like chemotaxis protein